MIIYFTTFQAARALKELSILWDDIQFPSEAEMLALDQLGAALRPLELLTKNICSEHFTILQADTIFQTVCRALHSQKTEIADKLVKALEQRYAERKNTKLLSALRFLSNPMDYKPGHGSLEMFELRIELKRLCDRLQIEKDLEQEEEVHGGNVTESDPGYSCSIGVSHGQDFQEKSYAEKLAAQIAADLQTIGVCKAKKNINIEAEINLASKTGELTERLQLVLKALESVQASSVVSERAFSIAGRFVTKIRNRLGDKSLDSFCFAKHKFQIEQRLVNICTILLFRIS